MSDTPAIDPEAVPKALPPDKLFRRADLSALAFNTTRELTPAPMLAGQRRAEEAIRLGAGLAARGFNIFATGQTKARISSSLRQMLETVPPPGKPLQDWVYVNNFAVSHRPTAIGLPAGRAVVLQQAMRKMIEDLRVTLPALFESDDYQRRRTAIDETLRANTQKVFQALGEKATSRGLAIIRTPMGFTVAAMDKGEIIEAEAFSKWPEARKKATQEAIAEIESEMEESLRSIPKLEKERRDAINALSQETARFAINQEIDELRASFAELPEVLDHIEAVRNDVLQHVQLFLGQSEGESVTRLDAMPLGHPFERYDVNVLVSNDPDNHSPVVEELNPTLGNLLGRVEHMSFQGALVTNFRMIKAGSLHRANGGTIVIDARSLFTEPYAWSALRRVLVRQEIVIEDLAHIVGLMSTATLEPSPIPLNVKVILFGERLIYYLLAALDPEFQQHFKILADFEDELERSTEGEALLARLIGGMATEAGLRALDRSGVEAAIERAARLTDDACKLSLMIEDIHDLVIEADHWAGAAGRDIITRTDVEQALRAQRRRVSRLEERSREMIMREVSLIATEGSEVGQINGLSVMTLAGHAFGRPSRITARVGPGSGKIVDIEREVELGGPIHSKGVLILSGFIAGRFALDNPMSLQASLVFEQSYGGVEGDSASVAELCALLSALANLPLRQELAVTGSVNQRGDVQAIGGVNEKIEGFFDICVARGLSRGQGVLIPVANVQHLMLRQDVVQACRDGDFNVYAVRTIDDAITLLTGHPAGSRGRDGHYAEGSVNHAVEACLARFAAARRAFTADGEERKR
ncbi:Lon protease family protein [Reyranella sp.]|uniref:Lon protease family protein n=1 Tax=Reyranella sp. TaxID=1929291 RepID=UPI003783E611